MSERREKVVLTLDDRFSGPMTRAAASAALLNHELERMDTLGRRSSRVMGNNARGVDRYNTAASRLNGTLRDSNNQLGRLGGSIGLVRVDRQANTTGRSIDRLSGRLRLFADAAALVGPAFIPLGALAAPAVAGLTTQLGFAAAAGGTAILAFQGFGEAFKAVSKAALEPTTANLTAARLAMERLSPAAQDFVRQLRSLSDVGSGLRNAASEGLFPGLSKSLDTIQTRVPQVERILFNLGSVLGDIAANGAASLASGRWDAFFNFFEQEARTTLTALAEAVGNLGHAFTNLIIQSAPLSHGFSDWLVEATARFDEFTAGIGKSNGFAEFIDYIQANGPQVAETVGAISMALLDVVEAAAPLGGPALMALEAVAKVISLIANSPLGPALFGALAAMSLLSRATALFGATGARAWAQNISGANGYVAALGTARATAIKAGAGIAGLALVSSGAADKIGLQNTAMFATAGLMVGGPWGAAIGGGIGLIADFAASNDDAVVSSESLTATLNQQTGAITENTRVAVAKSLIDADAYKAADKLGVSYDDVTAAALGNAAAQARVQAAIEGSMSAAQASSPIVSEQQTAINDVAWAADDLTGAIDASSGAVSQSQKDWGVLNGVLHETGNAMSIAEAQTQNYISAMTQLNNLLDKRASIRDYHQALLDATEAIKKNGRTLDKNTQAGLDNQAALDNIANTAFKLADHLKPLDKARVLTQARRDLINTAVDMGQSRKKAIELANQMFDLDKIKANPKVELNTEPVKSAINTINGWLNGIEDEQVNVNVVRRTTMLPGMVPGDGVPRAQGGPVYGRGTSTSDSIPARLSNGEYVQKAAAVRKYGVKMMHDINSLKFASGGYVGRGKSGMGVDRDYMHLSRGARDASNGMREVGKQSKAAAAEIERQKNELQSLRQKAQSIRSGARGAFNNDAFGGSVTDLRTQLEADRNDARKARAALRKAKAHGLNGPLATQIAQSGNVALAQQVAGMSRAEIRKLEQLYSQRASAQNGLGNQAVAMTRLGHQISRLEDTIKKGNHRGPRDAKVLEDAVYRGAKDGTAERRRQDNRRVAAGSRTGR